jgi:hypothetical protein
LAFHKVQQENGGLPPALHPTLAALGIVLQQNEDFGMITRSHPDLEMHKYYKRDIIFRSDISHLLPQRAERWWEDLGECSKLFCYFSYDP